MNETLTVFAPAGTVSGFGPLNSAVQSTVDHAVDRFLREGPPVIIAAMNRDVLPGLVRTVQTDVLPQLLANQQLQQNLGASVGRAVADRLRVPVWIGVGAIGVGALALAVMAGRSLATSNR